MALLFGFAQFGLLWKETYAKWDRLYNIGVSGATVTWASSEYTNSASTTYQYMAIG